MGILSKLGSKAGVRRLLAAGLLMILLLNSTACDLYVYMELYPPQVNSKWVCSDPMIVMEHIESYAGYIYNYYYVMDGEKHPIAVGFVESSFEMLPREVINGEWTVNGDKLLLRGSWTYRQGNLILMIEVDNLYDGKYTELEFEPMGKPLR